MNENQSVSDYARYISNSLIEYRYLNKRQVRKILKMLKKREIINDINSDIDCKEDLINKLNSKKREKVLKVIEEYEYQKPYKYSILYEIEDLSNIEEKVKKVINSRKGFLEPEIDYLSQVFRKPSIINEENLLEFKFSYIIKNREDDSTTIKYPVVVVIHKKSSILQIKFDSLSVDYKIGNYFVAINKKIKAWFEKILKMKLIHVNVLKIVANIVEKKENNPEEYEEVTEYIKDLEDRYNGRTSLKANNNDDLPIIDQLKSLSESFENEEDRLLLEDFIEDFEAGVKYHERGLKWKREGKTGRKIKQIVSFKKNYSNEGFTLCHFYGGNQTKERMNYVIRYLGKHK